MYWFLILAVMLASFIVQRVLSSRFEKYSGEPSPHGLTGADVARLMLQQNGITDVQVQSVAGRLTDHYNPQTKTVNLSDDVFGSASIAAVAVAAHETGHALQHRDAYAPLVLRSAAVPTVNIGSHLSWPLVIAGLIFSWQPLVTAGIALFALVVLFALITLPVEFNASSRALATLEGQGYLDAEEMTGARKVLNAAAMTYVASALSAILQLVRLIAISGNGRRRR